MRNTQNDYHGVTGHVLHSVERGAAVRLWRYLPSVRGGAFELTGGETGAVSSAFSERARKDMQGVFKRSDLTRHRGRPLIAGLRAVETGCPLKSLT